MVAALNTRKPVVTIQEEDLGAFPIWEFCLDEVGREGMDETWIRPVDSATIPRGAYALTVAAALTAANGFEFNGLVAVDTAERFEISGFAMPFPRYCFVAAPASDADKIAFVRVVGATPESVFPVRYRLCALVEGEATPRTGEIN